MALWRVPFLEQLARDQEVIMFDNRGMGFSKDYTDTQAISIELMANDTLYLVESLDLGEAPNLLGLSMGGFIATASAALHGDAYNKVIIVAGSAGSPNSEAPTALAQETLISPNSDPLTSLNVSFPLQYPAAAAAACDRYFDPDPPVNDPENSTTFIRQAFGVLDYFYTDTTVWDAVPSIENDLLLVGGEDDLIVPPQNVRAIADRVPTPWLVIFREAGHAAMWQYNNDFLSLVDTFLSFPAE